MTAWRLAKSLESLRAELNAARPNRDKSSDGTIGDAAHAATASDHNPNAAGVVCAYDVDTDLDGTNNDNDPDMARLVEFFRTHPHRDLKYIIYNHRMFSAYARPPYAPFEWRPYTGADPHVNHAHISVGVGPDGHSAQPYDDTDSWGVLLALSGPVPSPPRRDKVNAITAENVFEIEGNGNIRARNIAKGAPWYSLGKPDGMPVSIDADERPDGTIDVSVKTDKGVIWVTGRKPGPGQIFEPWYACP